MVNKKLFITLGILILIGLFFAFTPQQEQNVTKIGVLIPLSGDFATWGEKFREGVQSVPAENVKFIFEDTKCANVDTLNSFRKLVDIDQVQYFIGPACGSPQEVVAPHFKEQDILSIVPVAATNKLFTQSGNKIFQMQYSLEDESQHLAEQMHALGYTNVALITYQNAFSQTHADSFKKHFKGTVHEVIFPNIGAEIYTEITKVNEFKPDAIFVTDISFFVINGLQLLEQRGNQAPVFSQYATQYEAIREFVEGVTYSFPGNIVSDKSAEYSLAKEAIELLIITLDSCEQDYHCVLKTLSEDPQFDEQGISTRPIVFKKIENGQPVIVS